MNRFIVLLITVCMSSVAIAASPFSGYEARIAALEAQVAVLNDLLMHFSRDGNDIYIDGANLHLTNGMSGSQTVNGLGNLTIGYNELREDFHTPDCPDGLYCDRRGGSHNLVLGIYNNYTSSGGLVAGGLNEIANFNATVSGGYQNVASGHLSSVCGGSGGTASGSRSSVSGGYFNTASGEVSSVSGGDGNTASGQFSSVSGGNGGTASGDSSSVSGGQFGTASSSSCTVADNYTDC